jgi:hypothetical protein
MCAICRLCLRQANEVSIYTKQYLSLWLKTWMCVQLVTGVCHLVISYLKRQSSAV